MSQVTHIEIVRTDAAQPFHVRFVAGNGEPVATGENLVSERAARKAIRSMAALFGYFETDIIILPATVSGSLISEPSGHVICPVRVIDERVVDERGGA